MVRSCLRPARSMREAATTVMSTFMTCTPTLASAAFVMPACRHDSTSVWDPTWIISDERISRLRVLSVKISLTDRCSWGDS